MVSPLGLLPGQDDQRTSAHSCTASVLYHCRLLVSGAQWSLALLCHAGNIVYTCYNWTGDLIENLQNIFQLIYMYM